MGGNFKIQIPICWLKSSWSLHYTMTFLRFRGGAGWYKEKKGVGELTLELNCPSAEWHSHPFNRWGSIPVTDILEWGQPFTPPNLTEQPVHINYLQISSQGIAQESSVDLSLKEIIKNESVQHFFCSHSGGIRKTVSPKENGFNFRFQIHMRGICTFLEMAIVCGAMGRRLKFLRTESGACEVRLWKAPHVRGQRLLTHMCPSVTSPQHSPQTGRSFCGP